MNHIQNNNIEVLAPAGSFDALKAAIYAGADAVYAGGSRFGARAFAENFTEEELLEAIDYVHIHGKKLYLTVNTLIKDDELTDFYNYLRPYYERGLDAVIVQDVGALRLIRREFPDMAVHASTQMTITNVIAARYLESIGVERVVPARELSLQEIQEIRQQTNLEIECFVHGALCYCYSGQCLLSSLIGGRSGNRGQCAQPCRLPYSTNGTKASRDLMSLKDLCTIEHIPELIEGGITSFKIEGRMKQPFYVETVTRMYRKYVDTYYREGKDGFHVSQADKNQLLGAYQRRGYHDGYYFQHNGKDMLSLERPKKTQNEEMRLIEGLDYKIQEKINGKLIISPEKRAKLTVVFEDKDVNLSVTKEGDIVQSAKKQPLSKERLEKQLQKTGNTPFVFEHLEIIVEGEVFLPMQSVNELRRQALEELEERLLEKYRRVAVKSEHTAITLPTKTQKDWEVTVSVETLEQLNAAMKFSFVKRVYVDDTLFFGKTKEKLILMTESAKEKGIAVYISTPRIFRNEALNIYQGKVSQLNKVFDGAMVRNLESYLFLKENGFQKPIVSDANLYQWNKEAKAFFADLELERTTAPIELNYRELKKLGISNMELVTYGYIPVMITAGCIQKNTNGCTKKSGALILTDRYQKKFVVKNECNYCYNVMYNTDPLVLLDQKEEINQLRPRALRLSFTVEDEAKTEDILSKYETVFILDREVVMNDGSYTRGHFKRGVK